ncbi:MAG: hypothetical protein KC684_08360 [Candidatus Omnitrophica bacterium]|nr:hypothetical protein [Candidatus Omnitrophota bacterium]
MTEEKPSEKDDELQFDKAIPAGRSSETSRCTLCDSPLTGQYYKLNENITCTRCKEATEQQFQSGSAGGRLLISLVLGIPAAVVGSGIYYAIMALTGYEIGLVAIVIGFLVGAAVRKGANYRGGWLYQTIAVVLTYMAICSTYMPYIIEGAGQEGGGLFFYLIVFILALISPFLMGFENIIGWIIIGIGVFEAWKMNKKAQLDIQGPFDIKPTATA